MTIFLDTANLDEIRKWLKTGIISGITTNQKIFLKEKGTDYKTRIKEICRLSPGSVSVELTSGASPNVGDLILRNEGIQLHSLCPEKIVIKIPMWGNGRGLRVAKLLKEQHIPINITCCISINQAILACELNVEYVSFFYRRMLDYLLSSTTRDEEKARTIVKNTFIKTRNFIEQQHFFTKIIGGSVRKVEDIKNILCSGAHIATIPPSILQHLPQHPKTEATITEFDNCWKQFTSEDSP